MKDRKVLLGFWGVLLMWTLAIVSPVLADTDWDSVYYEVHCNRMGASGDYPYMGMYGSSGKGYYSHVWDYGGGTVTFIFHWDPAAQTWVMVNNVGGTEYTELVGTPDGPQSGWWSCIGGPEYLTILQHSLQGSGGWRSGDDEGATKDPVNTVSGAMFMDETDVIVPGSDLAWVRSYNSIAPETGPLGPRWTHNYDWGVNETTLAQGHPGLILRMGGGYEKTLIRDGTNRTWISTRDTTMTVTGFTNGEYGLTLPAGLAVRFGTNGLVASMSDAWQTRLSFEYTNANGSLWLSRVSEDDGRSLTFAYGSNRLLRVDGPSTNLCVYYAYNGDGELTNVLVRTSQGDATTTYVYDAAGTNRNHSVVRRVDPAGTVITYAYATNTVGQTLSACTRVVVSSNTYEHTVSCNTNAGFATVTYLRDGTNQVYQYVSNPYADMRRIVKIQGPGDTNIVHQFDYDDRTGMLTNEVWRNGATGDWLRVTRQWDDRLHPTNVWSGFNATSAYNQTMSYAWSTNLDLPDSMMDGEGHRTEWDYTNGVIWHRRVFPVANQPAETAYAYTTNGLLTSVTNANGHWVKYLYDNYGYPTSVIPQVGPTNWMVWNSLGHLKEIDLPSSDYTTNDSPVMIPRSILFDPDELGRVRQITWPDGTYETFGFDAIGNVTNHVDVAGRSTSFTWLPTRKLASTTRMLGTQAATVGLDYDQQMNVVKVRDELGRAVETYQLDLQDRPIQVTNVESQQMTIVWGLAEFLKSIVRFDGTTNAFFYDEGGRVNQVTYPDATLTYRHFRNGLPMTASNQWGVISNAYDGANRLVGQVTPVSNGTLSYALYPAGQVSNVVSAAGTNAYTLDAAERLVTLTAARKGLASESFQYGYNGINGAVSSVTYSNGLTCSMAYDKLDRPTAIVWATASNQVLRSRAYAYNAVGMITNIAYETGEQVIYSYDSLDRLTGEQHLNAAGQTTSRETYGFDLTGNRTNKTVWSGTAPLLTVNYTLSTGNRLASWSVGETDLVGQVDVAGVSSEAIGTNDRFGWLYVSTLTSGTSIKPYVAGTNFWAYDLMVGLGTQKVVAAIRDAAGNTTRMTNEVFLTVVTNGTYQYSAAGCVTNIAYRGKDYAQTIGLTWDGQYQLTAVTTNGAVAERYGYDAYGRRIWTWDAINGTNWMVYDGPHVVAEIDASGNLTKSYVYGPGIDNALSMTVYGTATNTYYYLKDHLNSVLALTDSAGQVVEQYRYDAWGRTTVYDVSGSPLNQSAYGNRYCWQGREYSWKTGLYYFRARWYDPVTGRWLSNDPIGISGGLNQYVFCANNPVNFTDPFGLCSDSDDGYSYDQFCEDLWGAVDELGRDLRRPLDRLAGAVRDFFRDDSASHQPPEITAYQPNTDLLLFVGATKGPKGWKPVKDVPFDPHGQPVYQKGSRYLTPDADSHKGGVWKIFDSKGRRLGTYDGTGNRIGR